MPNPGAVGADTERSAESAVHVDSAAAKPRAEAKRRARRQERLMLALVGLMALAIVADLTGELGIIPNLDWPASETVSLILAAAALWHWRAQARFQHRAERALEQQIAAVKRSERRYRDFADAAAHYMWEVGPDLRFTYVSDSIERVTGERPADIVGRKRAEVRPDDPHSESNTDRLRAQVAAGVPFSEVLVTRQARDGRTLHLMTSGKPYFDDSGNYLGFRGISRDVTAETAARRQLADSNAALQKTTKALAESEQRFRDFANAASDWFWETGPDHRFTFILRSDALQPDRHGAGSLGMTRREANPGGATPEEWDRHEADLRAHQPFRDFRYLRARGTSEERYLSINGVPVFDHEGRFLGYRGTGRDITLQLLAEEAASQAARARDHAEATSRAKTQFLAHTSHELRTPLNAIIGFSEVMETQMLGPIGHVKYRDYARDIGASARHLLELINDMLDMARIEVGKYRIEPGEVDAAMLIEQVMNMTRGLAEGGGVTLESAGVTPGTLIHVDARAIKQVLVNLISNSIKFTPAGGSIGLRMARREDGGLDVTVRDTGRGIPAAVLPRLFEPYQQASADCARAGGGAGLGLWISRNLMRLHEGELTIASVEGKGTTATLSLPAHRIVDPPAAQAQAVA